MSTTILTVLVCLASFGPADASATAPRDDSGGVVEASSAVNHRRDADRPCFVTEAADDEDDFDDVDGIMPVASSSSSLVFGQESPGSIRKDFARPAPAPRSPILRC